MPILAIVAILFAVAADASPITVHSKSSYIGYDGNMGFNKPYVKIEGQNFPLSVESAHAACVQMGYEYSVSVTSAQALWGNYQVYAINGDGTMSGPYESPVKLTYLRCYSYANTLARMMSGHVRFPFEWPGH